MATHRSLNKLEFKAHMSIHNVREVEDGETHESNATRDRFGKKHPLSDRDGTPRIRRRPTRPAAIAVLASLLCLSAQAGGGSTIPSTTRNTDVRVETEGLDENSWLNKKLNQPQERFGIAVDESTSLEVNEDGDPNLNMRF